MEMACFFLKSIFVCKPEILNSFKIDKKLMGMVFKQSFKYFINEKIFLIKVTIKLGQCKVIVNFYCQFKIN